MATKKTGKIKAVKVDAKGGKVNATRRKTAKAAESAATAREEELAKTLVSKADFRKLLVRVKEVENIVNQNYDDIIHLDTRLGHVERATMWQSVKKFFSRKVW